MSGEKSITPFVALTQSKMWPLVKLTQVLKAQKPLTNQPNVCGSSAQISKRIGKLLGIKAFYKNVFWI